ncbi:MAG: glycoside hydrolase family 3 C-terminal domain-containing protein [Clostridia bacterium]|nr:glycoside hydrolase family 3 C-terminal domain-containing protein [Clostridia bacterium]
MNGKIKKLSLRQKAQLVSGKSFWQTQEYTDAGVKSITFSDGPSGLRVQNGKSDSMGLNASKASTCFPAHSALACSFNTELVNKVGFALGEEAAHFGVSVLLAPAINIKRNPLNGRNFEYFSEDPYLSGVMGREYISGVQSQGVGACVKHFAANNKELGRTVYDSAVDMRTLREIYLTAFEIAVKCARPAAVMTAYNRLNGVYCNENKWLLSDVLRGEWGHEGIVVSDWGGTSNRVAGIKAGADLEMPFCKFSADEILDAIKNGELTEEELDSCAHRIINLSDKLNGEKPTVQCDFDKNASFAERCAEECAVLLKNDGILPLNKNVKFALIGDIAQNAVQGGGSSKVNPTRVTTLLQCFEREENFAGYARGYNQNGKNSAFLLKKALKLAKNADIIVCAVGVTSGEAEGVDRENIRLDENQIELLNALKKTGKRIVAVLSCGGAVETDWDEGLNALLLAGLNGQGGAKAVKRLIFGEICPSGKLAETFPHKLEDLPSTQYFTNNAYACEYKEGMRVGYRGLTGAKYPFGFGLSYTQFGYSDIQFGYSNFSKTPDFVSFSLKNEGNFDGAEAAQLYIEFPENANSPKLQLKGFAKVFLKAGESATVKIPFDEYSFRSFDVKSGKWVTARGLYKIYIGASSEDLRLCGEVELDGVDGVAPAECESVSAEEYQIARNEKGRVIANFGAPFSELRNSRGALGRLAARIAFAATKRNPTANGTMRYVTLRTAAQFAKFGKVRASGLVDIFDGKPLRGIGKIIRGEKKIKDE